MISLNLLSLLNRQSTSQSPREIAKAVEWFDSHGTKFPNCAKIDEVGACDMYVELHETSIGTALYAACRCGEKEDCTDYESW